MYILIIVHIYVINYYDPRPDDIMHMYIYAYNIEWLTVDRKEQKGLFYFVAGLESTQIKR